jgi:hypothetical protein
VAKGHVAAGEREQRLNQDVPPLTGRRAWLLAWLAFLPLAVMRAGTLAESDTFWQIRVGLVTLDHHAIPRVDTFSWTMYGKPWTLNSWGFNLVVAAAYRVAGLPGAAWACAGLVMAAAAMVLMAARQLGAHPFLAGGVLVLTSPLVIAWFSARPQLVDYVAVPALILLLRRTAGGGNQSGSLSPRRRDQARSVIAVGALAVVWVNLHAASLLGVAIAGLSGLLLAIRPGTRVNGLWCGAAAVAALAGSLVNPYGVGVFTQTAQVQSSSAGVVTEWQHINPASVIEWLVVVLGVAALALAVRRRDAVLISALAITVPGAVLAIRLLPILAVVAVPVLAASASQPVVMRYIRSRRFMLTLGAVAIESAFVILAAVNLTHIGRPLPAYYPKRLVTAIPHGCRLFNSYLVGGYVILERPDVKVSLDSRNDLYGPKRVLAEQGLVRRGGDVPARAGCVLVPTSSVLARQLDRDPGWNVRAREVGSVLFVRH